MSPKKEERMLRVLEKTADQMDEVAAGIKAADLSSPKTLIMTKSAAGSPPPKSARRLSAKTVRLRVGVLAMTWIEQHCAQCKSIIKPRCRAHCFVYQHEQQLRPDFPAEKFRGGQINVVKKRGADAPGA